MKRLLVFGTWIGLLATGTLFAAGTGRHHCTDLDSGSGLDLYITNEFEEVILGKTEGPIYDMTSMSSAYKWTGGSSQAQASTPLIQYSASYDLYPKPVSGLPTYFRLEYLQTAAKEFPAYFLLKLSEGLVYHVYKMSCSPDL